MADKRKTTTSNINWEQIAVFVIALLIAAVIAIICICCTALVNKGEDNPGSGGNGGTTQEQPDTDSPDNPDERYGISIVARLDNNSVEVSEYLECNIATEAAAGETVTFTAKSKSENFVIEFITNDKGEFLIEKNGVYSFVMPEYKVSITVHLVESSVPLYRITWDLDRTTSIALDINEIECSLPERAKAGAVFVFTITVKNPAYTVREAVLVGGNDSGSLLKSGNTSKFFLTMPAADISIVIYVDEVQL